MSAAHVSALLIAPFLPYPPDRGGKADVWRRAEALRRCGARVLLACPRADAATEALASDAAEKAGIELLPFDAVPLRRALIQWLVGSMHGLPLFSARRLPSPACRERLVERAGRLNVNVVVSEGPWLWPVAHAMATSLHCPLVYRSHNIESMYMKRQRELERSSRARLGMLLSFAGLERFERRAIAASDWLFDISADDLGHWRHPRARCLPPIPASPADAASAERASGVVFLGNLRTPNNLAGLRLLLNEVMPAVRREVPTMPFHVVGSAPEPHTEQWIRASGADLHKDVSNPLGWLMGADCIVNPVLYGSGVQLKTLDMLQTDRPLITFAQGLRGLPPQVHTTVNMVSTAAEMAKAVVALHRQGFPPVPNRASVRALFDERAFYSMLNEVVQ